MFELPGDCEVPWGFDQERADQVDWSIWPSLDPRPWCRFGCASTACDCGGCAAGCNLPSVPMRPRVTHPKFATGQDLWRHAMPRDIRPDDPRLEKGEWKPIVKGGPLQPVGGVLYAPAMEGVEVEHRSTPGMRFAARVEGLRLVVELETDSGGAVQTTPRDILQALRDVDMADALLQRVRVQPGVALAAPAAPTRLTWPQGTLSYVQGAPTSTFVIIVECMRSGYLTLRPQFNQVIPAEFRCTLNGGRAWTMTRPYDDRPFEIETCGITLRLGDGGAADKKEPPFVRGMRFVMETRESIQIDKVLRAAAADMVRRISVSEVTPLRRWEEDLRSINAILAANKLLRGPRGIDASPKASGGYQYDEEIAKRAREATADLDDIADAYQQLVCEASGETDGVDAVSRAPQGIGWL